MKQFADPSMFEALSMGDKIVGALITTLMGMGVTFVILTMLWCFIAIMSRAMGVTVRSKADEAPAPAVEEAAAEERGSEIDENELIAVITAAIAGNQRNKSHIGLKLKKIERIYR